MATRRTHQLTAALLLSMLSTSGWSAGFAISEQSVTGLGRAFAGSAAVAEDASTIFYNPAGLTYLAQPELDVGLHIIDPKSDFSNNGSNIGGILPITGPNDDGGKTALVPNLYYAHKINNRWFAGIGINAPFGLVTEYNDNWVGRYHAIKSDLKTININPSFAFKVTDKWSFGAGINLQKIDLKLTQAVDFGAIFTTPQTADGKVYLSADDWSWGYNLGIMYQPTNATRLALSYRSKISQHLKGTGRFAYPNATIQTLATTLAGFKDGHIEGKVTLPETVSFAFYHQLNTQWAVMADATLTRWNRFSDLTIVSSDSLRLNSSKPEHWRNSMRYGLGVNYQHNNKWTFRGGIAYDESPIATRYRTPRIPGEDRKWVALGATYHYSHHILIDAGYTHIFVKDPKLDDVTPTGYALTGKFNANVDIFSMQLRWLFQ